MRNADRKIRLVMLLSPTLGPVALVQVDEDNGNIVSVGNADIRQTDALKDIYLAHRRRSVCSSPSFHQDKVVTISREHGSEVLAGNVYEIHTLAPLKLSFSGEQPFKVEVTDANAVMVLDVEQPGLTGTKYVQVRLPSHEDFASKGLKSAENALSKLIAALQEKHQQFDQAVSDANFIEPDQLETTLRTQHGAQVLSVKGRNRSSNPDDVRGIIYAALARSFSIRHKRKRLQAELDETDNARNRLLRELHELPDVN